MTDYWVVGKKSDQRELYVILNQKNANLIEVNGRSAATFVSYPPPDVHKTTLVCPSSFAEEVKRLCATQFNNIFFLD